MADGFRSFQFLDINETQLIGHWHLDYSYNTTLAHRIKHNNKKF